MTTPLIIVGAGGHARETAYAYLLGAHRDSFLGFLDDQASGTTPEGWPILGTIETASSHPHASFVIAINDPRTRRSVADRLARSGVSQWGSVVHPDVRVHKSVQLGAGCSILGGCQLTTNIRLGDHCILNRGSQVSHDCVIGSYCSLNPAACLAGSVTVGDGCEIGSACAIRQGTRVGRGCTLGLACAVVSDVSDDAVMVGNPARLLRSNIPW